MSLYVNGVETEPLEVCKILGFSNSQIPRHTRLKIFKRVDIPHNRLDVQTGRPLKAGAYHMTNSFRVLGENKSEYRITYAERHDYDYETKKTTFTPNSLVIEGSTLAIDSEKEFSKFLFLYLNTSNKNSPIIRNAVGNTQPVYEYQDIEKESKEALDLEDAYMDAYLYIKNLDSSTLKVIARGYGLLNAESKWDSELRLFIKEKAKKDPRLFMYEVNHNELPMRGIIIDAFEKNLIKSSLNGKGKSWYIDDELICKTAIGNNELQYVIKGVFERPEDLFPLISDALDKYYNQFTLDSQVLKDEVSKFLNNKIEKHQREVIDPQLRKEIKKEKAIKTDLKATQDRIMQLAKMDENDSTLKITDKRDFELYANEIAEARTHLKNNPTLEL